METRQRRLRAGFIVGFLITMAYSSRLSAGIDLGDVVEEPVRIESGINLSDQWGDRPVQYQGEFGYCHTFAVVGLIEAAYFRKYGEPIDLSEKWVLYKRYLLARKTKMRKLKEELEQSGSAQDDHEMYIEERRLFLDFAGEQDADLSNTMAEEIQSHEQEIIYRTEEMRIAGDSDNPFNPWELAQPGVCEEETYPYWDFSNLSPREERIIGSLLSDKEFFANFLALEVGSSLWNKERLKLLKKCPFPFFPEKLCFYNEIVRRYNKLFGNSIVRRPCRKQAASTEDFIKGLDLVVFDCYPNCRDSINALLLAEIPVGIGITDYPQEGSGHALIISGYEPASEEPEASGIYLTRDSLKQDEYPPLEEERSKDIDLIYIVVERDNESLPTP
ncbi:hypothetical protein ACFL6Y_03000 [Elusimicrobiota bacterium]